MSYNLGEGFVSFGPLGSLLQRVGITEAPLRDENRKLDDGNLGAILDQVKRFNGGP
jgi:hypothetical protein